MVRASAETLDELVSDITVTGEWSPGCTPCWWDDETDAGRTGAWFIGRNELSHRSSENRSQRVIAARGREFAWVVGGNSVRWGYTLTPTVTETILNES